MRVALAQGARKRLERAIRKGVEIGDLEKWPTDSELADFAKSTLPAHYSSNEGHPKPSKLDEVLRAVQKYSPAFDIFFQQQPFLAAIAWGTCRALVQVRFTYPLGSEL